MGPGSGRLSFLGSAVSRMDASMGAGAILGWSVDQGSKELCLQLDMSKRFSSLLSFAKYPSNIKDEIQH